MDNYVLEQYIKLGDEFIDFLNDHHNGLKESNVKVLKNKYIRNLKKLSFSSIDTTHSNVDGDFIKMAFIKQPIFDDQTFIKKFIMYNEESKVDYDIINNLAYYYFNRDSYIIVSKDNNVRKIVKMFNTIFYEDDPLYLYPYNGNNLFGRIN